MRLWGVQVEHWNKLDEDWDPAFSLERGRFFFDSAESAKASADDLFPGMRWFEQYDGDWTAQPDDAVRVSVHWVEGRPQGGRD